MIAIVLGTRPEIIKMSPVIRVCEKEDLDFFILHTGQHYSHEMDHVFFLDLELPQAKYNLKVGSGTHAEQTGKIMTGVETVLQQEQPSIVLVQGDTNTVLAATLAAAKLQIPIGHVEAGLRSFNKSMPEEINRIVADHLSTYLFAPTEGAVQNLVQEGIPPESIFLCGNTVVDAVRQNIRIAQSKKEVLDTLRLKPFDYFLVTVHRAENTDDKNRLEGIISGLQRIQEQFSRTVVFPVHPRTRKMIDRFGIPMDGILMTEPFGYLEFLYLESLASLVLTDSGGIQEESCILQVPCITLRNETERPETIRVGANIIAGHEPDTIVSASEAMLDRVRGWENPFGDGKAAEKIIDWCCKQLSCT
jgi:UDP-N-acetylglucosamine 2-epimerase (non-hydrolysing)